MYNLLNKNSKIKHSLILFHFISFILIIITMEDVASYGREIETASAFNANVIPLFERKEERVLPVYHQRENYFTYTEKARFFPNYKIVNMNQRLHARSIARNIDNIKMITDPYFINMNRFCDKCQLFHKTVSEAQEHEFEELTEMRRFLYENSERTKLIASKNLYVYNWHLEKRWMIMIDDENKKKQETDRKKEKL